MIKKELLEKYGLVSLGEYKKIFNEQPNVETDFYRTFLAQTDYLAMKLAEGLITRDDKKEEFDARDFARAEINRLQVEK